MTAIIDKNIPQKDSLSMWDIERELNKIGVPFVQISWEDEFLMAENLQNYFAEVVATFSYIRRNGKDYTVEDRNLKNRKLRWLDLRNKHYSLSFSEKQQLLIDLMREGKYLSAKYDNTNCLLNLLNR